MYSTLFKRHIQKYVLIRNLDLSKGLGVDLSDLKSAEVNAFLKVRLNVAKDLKRTNQNCWLLDKLTFGFRI
jgi:hypothetical protein